MMLVIRYKDGFFNQGLGFPCRLAEATRYKTFREALWRAAHLADVDRILDESNASDRPEIS